MGFLKKIFGSGQSTKNSIPSTKSSKSTALKTAKSPSKIKVENEEFRNYAGRVANIKKALLVMVEAVKEYEQDWKNVYAAQKAWSSKAEASYTDTDDFSELLKKSHRHMLGLDNIYDSKAKGPAGNGYRKMNDELMKYLGELNAIESGIHPIEVKQKELEKERKQLEKYEHELAKDKTSVNTASAKLETLTQSLQNMENERAMEKAQDKVDRESRHVDKYSDTFRKQQEKVEASKMEVQKVLQEYERMSDELLARMKAADAKKSVIFRSGLAATWLGFADYADGLSRHCADHFAMGKISKDAFIGMHLADVDEYNHPPVQFQSQLIKAPPRPPAPKAITPQHVSLPNEVPPPASAPLPVPHSPQQPYDTRATYPTQAPYPTQPQLQGSYHEGYGYPTPHAQPYGYPNQPPHQFYPSQGGYPAQVPASQYAHPPIPESSPMTASATPDSVVRADIYGSASHAYLKPSPAMG